MHTVDLVLLGDVVDAVLNLTEILASARELADQAADNVVRL
jgi:hypothetical protein